MFFHAIDEGNLDRWQSGIYFVDGSAKSSLAAVEDATRDTRGGVIAKCQGLSLTPKGKVVYPKSPTVKTVPLKVRLTVTSTAPTECGSSATRAARRRCRPAAKLRPETRPSSRLPPRRVAAGAIGSPYPDAPLNTGPPNQLASKPLKLR